MTDQANKDSDADQSRTKDKFFIKKEMTLGDLLIPLTIILSALTLWHTWDNDRQLHAKEYADKIRTSASVVTAKLQRWGTLADRYFDDLQPVLIEASKETSENHQYLPARRILYTGMKVAEGTASQRIVDEQLEIAYMDLYGYVPNLKPPFDQIRENIQRAEQASHERLENKLQTIDLQNRKALLSSDSATMGNLLRSDVESERVRLH